MAPKLNLTDNVCPKCIKTVVNKRIVCPGCQSVYHPACATRIGTLENGFYSKCCGTRSKSPNTMVNDSAPESTSQPFLKASDLESIIAKAISSPEKF